MKSRKFENNLFVTKRKGIIMQTDGIYYDVLDCCNVVYKGLWYFNINFVLLNIIIVETPLYLY